MATTLSTLPSLYGIEATRVRASGVIGVADSGAVDNAARATGTARARRGAVECATDTGASAMVSIVRAFRRDAGDDDDDGDDGDAPQCIVALAVLGEANLATVLHSMRGDFVRV